MEGPDTLSAYLTFVVWSKTAAATHLKPGDNKERSITLVPIPRTVVRHRARKQRWYQKWWVWTIVAGAAVTAASVTLPLLLYEKKAPRGSLGTLSYP